MPGPSNNKKGKKSKTQKKEKHALTDRTARHANGAQVDEGDGNERGRSTMPRPLEDHHPSQIVLPPSSSQDENRISTTRSDQGHHASNSFFEPLPQPVPDPFITNRGDGARVNNVRLFLSSFFCPPISKDRECSLFAPEEILTVLCAVLPEEIGLILWYNKTRNFGRICPACHRLFKLGDLIVDPVSGALVDVNDPSTPPQLLREQQLSGFCSLTCFLLACYSSHPYTSEVARGALGHLHDELDPTTRSLLDATDPRTAAIIRYGLAACPDPVQSPDGEHGGEKLEDAGLGRLMRMTRRTDLGLGEVLEAVKWYEEQKRSADVADHASKVEQGSPMFEIASSQ